MTTEHFAHSNRNPAHKFSTLEDLGLPVELCTFLCTRKRELAVISGTDATEVFTTMAALAHSLEARGHSTMFLKTKHFPSLPGITEIDADVRTFNKLFIFDQLKHVIFLDSLDTREKIIFAVNASLMGRTVVAPVVASSAEAVLVDLLNAGEGVNRYLVVDLLAYIAQQTRIQDPFSSDGSTLLDTHIMTMDAKLKKRIWAGKI